jgi:initiation factor 1A
MGKKIVKSYFRPPENEDEIVAIVDKNMGNGILNVKLPNGERLCHVRKKFGKERDFLKPGSWILVGLRNFETKQNKCDLLEVYSDSDVQRLMTMDGAWKVFAAKDTTFVDVEVEETSQVVLDLDINVDDI